MTRGDTAHAVENYILAAEKSTRSGVDKAISQITLGGIYFTQRNYEKAQPCYSEAVPLLPETYPDYQTLKRRSDVLDELAVYSQNVNLQDSLLRLAAMTPEQRLTVINKIIDDLKKKEKEEAEAAKREEYLAQQAANGSNLQSNSSNPTTFNLNTDNSWYFYNTATRNSGKTEFQRRWGSRKLEDNWRRRNKASFNTEEFDSSDSDNEDDSMAQAADTATVEQTDEQREAAEHANDPHYPEYYLAQIPETDEQKTTAHEVIQDGLYNMGVILKDKLEDFDSSRAEFDRLLSDYPDNTYRLDVYYNIYLMYMRENRSDLAEQYRQLILTEFADSKYGVAMRDPAYIDNLRLMETRQNELYEQTYDDYLNNRNAAVHDAYKNMSENYPLSPLMPKFMFLQALTYVTEHKPDEFNATLREMLERYPDTDLAPYASAWLKGMAQGRKLQTAATNMRGMVWDLKLSNDSIAGGDGEPLDFDLNPNTKQLLIMSFATDQVSSNALLFEIARHNFRSFVVKDFELEQMNFGRLGMIVISGFENMDELNHYRRVMAASQDFKLPAGVRPIVISDENFKKLMNEGRSFEEYFRYLEEQNYVDAQAGLLPMTEIETLPEAESGSHDLSEPLPDTEPSDEQSPATLSPQQAEKSNNPAKSDNPDNYGGSEGDDPLFDF
jgi:hypothetical protein